MTEPARPVVRVPMRTVAVGVLLVWLAAEVVF